MPGPDTIDFTITGKGQTDAMIILIKTDDPVYFFKPTPGLYRFSQGIGVQIHPFGNIAQGILGIDNKRGVSRTDNFHLPANTADKTRNIKGKQNHGLGRNSAGACFFPGKIFSIQQEDRQPGSPQKISGSCAGRSGTYNNDIIHAKRLPNFLKRAKPFHCHVPQRLP